MEQSRGAQVALSGIRAAKRVHGVLSEPNTTGVSFVDRLKNLITGAEPVPEVADDEPRPLRVSAPELSRLYRPTGWPLKPTMRAESP